MRAGSTPAGAAALVGVLFACWMYGWAVIDPRSTGWLTQNDAAAHFAGLVYFLNQPWHWPLGAILNFGDEPTSIVFTDCIPLLAIPAKALGFSGRVQYFGLWIVACHALAGWWGCRLLERLGTRGVATFAGGLFFAVSPMILLRAYGHESLIGQFLVIAALERSLRAEWRWRGWLVLLVVAALVHAYLATMVGVLGIATAASALWRGQVRPSALLAQGGASLAILFVFTWTAGYFVGSGDVFAEGYGHYSANLLTWFDPMDWRLFNGAWGREVPYVHEWSRFLKPVGQATNGQYEGFAYLGVGLLALALVALGAVLAAPREPAAEPIPPESWITVIVAGLLMLMLAVSTHVTFSTHTLFDVPVPAAMARALGTYRAGGRFVWPITYLFVAWVISRAATVRAGAWIVTAALLLQCADLSGKMREFRIHFHEPPPALELDSPVWDTLLANCPRLQMVSQLHPGDGWLAPALAAGQRGVLFTPAPTSRYSIQNDRARVANVHALLEKHAWQPGIVYLVAKPMPDGMTIDGVLASLPATMRTVTLGGAHLVFHESCMKR